MCFPSVHQNKPQSVPMNEKHHVAVFDPESCDLRRLPLDRLKGLFIVVSFYCRKCLISRVASEYEQVQVPRFKRRFSVWAPSELDRNSLENQSTKHTVVTRSTDDVEGKSFVARLYYPHLGLTPNVQRAYSSKHRTLYIGAIPDSRWT